MSSRTIQLDSFHVPRLLYGTAWKENETARLTELAIQSGFRGIDTANQRKHYNEEAVGFAVAKVIESGLVTRDDLFLQTKFTFQRGQDHRLPYDPAAKIATQVAQSFASSLEHLQTSRIDSYILHGPTTRRGLGPDDWEAWKAMEAIHESGQVRFLGISNVSLEQLQLLHQEARVKPRMAQIRCYATNAWDRNCRQFCKANEIMYQGFSLLTANRNVMTSPQVSQIANRHGRTPAQIIFRFALDAEMIALTGTTDSEHMLQDLSVFDFVLEPDELTSIETIATK